MPLATSTRKLFTDLQMTLGDRSDEVARLRQLLTGDGLPTVTVVGKYNHGKSMLLNALIGDAVFRVADKRETVELKPHAAGGVRWLDAPGLDADIEAKDDQKAAEAAWHQSDVRLFVHAAKEGELDAKELDLFKKLHGDRKAKGGRAVLLVLTQIDQLPDEAQLASVIQKISRQVGSEKLLPVSAKRYSQAMTKLGLHDCALSALRGPQPPSSPLLAKSGFRDLVAALGRELERVDRVRAAERATLAQQLLEAIDQRIEDQCNKARAMKRALEQRERKLASDLEAAIGR